MQIRLLSPFQFYKANHIVEVEASWERYLVLSGTATYDLTGGIPLVPPAEKRQLVPASLVQDAGQNVLGLDDPKGGIIALGGGPGGSAVTAVNVTGPVKKTGTASAPVIGMDAATTTAAGCMTPTQVLALSATSAAIAGAAAAGGFATLGADGLLAAAQRPPGGGIAESYSVLGFGAVTTPTLAAGAVTGGAVAVQAYECNCVIARNNSGVMVEFNRGGGAVFYRVRPGEVLPIFGITDASQIAFRRRDYATTRDSQRVNVNLTFVNTSLAYPVVQLVGGTNSGTAYLAAPSQVCVGAELTNNYNKDILVKIGTGVTRLNRNQTMVVGVTNVNQISCVSPDSTGAAAMCINAYTARMPGAGAPAREYNRADILSPEATIPLGDMQNGPFDQPAGIADFAPFKRIKFKRKTISVWSTAAKTIITAGLSKANVNLAADQVYGSYGPVTQFGSATAPNVTFTTDTTASILSEDNTPTPIDVTGGAIHVTVQKAAPASGGFTAMNIDLFSSGTPSAPGADFHTLNVFSDLSGGMSGLNSYGSRSYGAGRFAAVGAGADMTAVTFARIRIAGATNTTVIPGDVSFVPPATGKASIVFTIDDNHGKAVWDAHRMLSPYGYPVVLYMSPASRMIGGGANTDGNPTIDNLIALQQRYGWQMASQDYFDGTVADVDRTPQQWLVESRKNLIMAAQLGFELDGMRDGSLYGGYSYFIDGPITKGCERLFATIRRFDNGPGTAGDGLAPFAFADTNPPGDPYSLRSYNMDTYIGSQTAQQCFDKMKAYVDQAVANKGIAIFSTHTGYSDGTIAAAVVMLAAYIRTLEVAGTAEVVTLQTLRNRQL